jgi:hypothetical protein
MADNYELKTAEIKITKDVLTTQTFDSGDAVALMVELVSGSVEILTVYASETENGQYYQLVESRDCITPVTVRVEEKIRRIVPECYPHRWIRFVGDADGMIRIYSKHDAPISTMLKSIFPNR